MTFHNAEHPAEPIPPPPAFLPRPLRRGYTGFLMKLADWSMTRSLNRHLSHAGLHMTSWLRQPADFSLYPSPRSLFLPEPTEIPPDTAFTGFLTDPPGRFPPDEIDPADSSPILTFGSVSHPAMEKNFREFYRNWPVTETFRMQEGWHPLPEPPASASFRILGPAPHESLFPGAEVIVHHGGAGTTIAALLAGTPQIVVPHFADQSYWAKTVLRLGIGLRAGHKTWGRELPELARQIRNNPAYRDRARTVAREAAKTDGATTAVQQIEKWLTGPR